MNEVEWYPPVRAQPPGGKALWTLTAMCADRNKGVINPKVCVKVEREIPWEN
jgi:hypothetical protein